MDDLRALQKNGKVEKLVVLKVGYEAERKLAEKEVISHHLEVMLRTTGREAQMPMRAFLSQFPKLTKAKQLLSGILRKTRA